MFTTNPLNTPENTSFFSIARDFINDIKDNSVDYNFSEIDGEFKLTLCLPGINKDKLNINVTEDDKLSLKYEGEKTKDENEKKSYLIHNFDFGNDFEISFDLPENVEVNDISAKYVDGILYISIPKSKKSNKEKKKIKIS